MMERPLGQRPMVKPIDGEKGFECFDGFRHPPEFAEANRFQHARLVVRGIGSYRLASPARGNPWQWGIPKCSQ